MTLFKAFAAALAGASLLLQAATGETDGNQNVQRQN